MFMYSRRVPKAHANKNYMLIHLILPLSLSLHRSKVTLSQRLGASVGFCARIAKLTNKQVNEWFIPHMTCFPTMFRFGCLDSVYGQTNMTQTGRDTKGGGEIFHYCNLIIIVKQLQSNNIATEPVALLCHVTVRLAMAKATNPRSVSRCWRPHQVLQCQGKLEKPPEAYHVPMHTDTKQWLHMRT